MIKINPLYIIVVILLVCICFLYFQNLSVKKQIDKFQDESLKDKQRQIVKIDSVFNEKQKIQIHKNDSIFKLLTTKDSLLEIKNKLQDEKIRNINISNDLLPNF